jgi:thiol-disulfide isomerase/thioredoxin
MQNKSLFLLLVFVLFSATAALGYYGPLLLKQHRAEKAAESFAAPSMPQLRFDAFANNFNNVLTATQPQSLPDVPFEDLKGKKHRFSDFKGAPLLVNFWATWCLPCVVELTSLQRFAEHYKGRITVIGVALEVNKTKDEVSRFLETRELGDFAGYYYGGTDMGIRGLPTSVLVDANGQILYRFEGEADWASPEAQAFFDTFLLQKR